MNRLIKNELTKIFHKKSIYVLLIIILVFMIVEKVIYKVIDNNINEFDEIAFYEKQLEEFDKDVPENRETYMMFEAQLEKAKLVKQYGRESWQAHILNGKGYEIIYNMKIAEGTENYEVAKDQYEKLIKNLQSDDWKVYANEELKDVNAQIEMVSNNSDLEILKDNKKALEWRLEKNISYAVTNSNQLIEQWLQGRIQLKDYEEKTKKNTVSYEEEYENQQNKANVELARYAIENEIDERLNYVNATTFILTTEANAELIDVWQNYSTFIIIAIVIIAGTMISEEFNKGTIKLLLVRPYKRTKILISKFITCCIILAIVLISVVLMQFIVSGIAEGFNSFSNRIVIYNFDTNNVEAISLGRYLLLTALTNLPMFVLLMTLAFTLSTVFCNSPIAIAVPILGIMASEIINGIFFHYEKAKFLRFFVTPNWNLSMYLFGKMPQTDSISLQFSLIICFVYFIIMIALSLVVFKKKDIKNI